MAVQGDPSEGALLTLGRRLGLDPETENDARPRTAVIPFESQHRFMATLHDDQKGRAFVYVKGASERILEMCSFQRSPEGDAARDRAFREKMAGELADRGERVLALELMPAPGDRRDLTLGDVDQGGTPLGRAGIAAPPHPEAVEAVAACRSAGIRVKMITADHAHTALAIGARMGIGHGKRVIAGPDPEAAPADQLRRRVGEVHVFAGASPEHELRLVEALQAEGDVAAMTGDRPRGGGGAHGLRQHPQGHHLHPADQWPRGLVLLAAIALGRTLPITPVQSL